MTSYLDGFLFCNALANPYEATVALHDEQSVHGVFNEATSCFIVSSFHLFHAYAERRKRGKC